MGNILENLKDTIHIMGISRQVEAVGVVERAVKEIATFIPTEDFEVVSFNRGALKIATDSTIVAGEIKMRLGQEFLEKNEIKRLVFCGREAVSQR